MYQLIPLKFCSCSFMAASIPEVFHVPQVEPPQDHKWIRQWQNSAGTGTIGTFLHSAFYRTLKWLDFWRRGGKKPAVYKAHFIHGLNVEFCILYSYLRVMIFITDMNGKKKTQTAFALSQKWRWLRGQPAVLLIWNCDTNQWLLAICLFPSSVCSVLLLCETLLCACSYFLVMDFNAKTQTQIPKQSPSTHTHLHIHMPVNGSLISQSTLVFFWDWVDYCQGKGCVYQYFFCVIVCRLKHDPYKEIISCNVFIWGRQRPVFIQLRT